MAALARNRLRCWASYTFIYRPQVAWAYHVVYRKCEPLQRTIKSVYWPSLRALRVESNPLLRLLNSR